MQNNRQKYSLVYWIGRFVCCASFACKQYALHVIALGDLTMRLYVCLRGVIKSIPSYSHHGDCANNFLWEKTVEFTLAGEVHFWFLNGPV